MQTSVVITSNLSRFDGTENLDVYALIVTAEIFQDCN